mmetsp:Transcript_24474/g.61968  ORF Transcript_24474/g.61968 Transcript_24474/m.61968 type:complete len:254 (-) Transcript_24474:1506-2267(-)
MDLLLLEHAAPVRVDAVEDVPGCLIVHQPPRDLVLHLDDHGVNLLLEVLLEVPVHEILDTARLNGILHVLPHHLAVADDRVLRPGGDLLDAQALADKALVHAHVFDQTEGLKLGRVRLEAVLVVPQLVHEDVAHVAKLLVAVDLLCAALVQHTEHPRMLVRVAHNVPDHRVPQGVHVLPPLVLSLEERASVPLAHDDLAHKHLDDLEELVVRPDLHEPLRDARCHSLQPCLLRLLDPAPRPMLQRGQSLRSEH